MNNRVGLGTFPLAGVFTPTSSDDAQKIIHKFIDLGGYYFDTAPVYGNGEIEKLLGHSLKGIPREKYYLGTKTIKHVDVDGRVFKSGRYADVVKQIDNSLSRLNTNYVDLLMVHLPDEETPIDETLRAMEDLQKAGKVKELAVSNVSLDELVAYNTTGKIKYVQNRFSLISRSLSTEFQNYLLENNIYLLPYHLLEIGLLTNLALEEFHLREGDLREKLPYWNNENQAVIFEWVKNNLGPIATELGITIGQLTIAWTLAQPFVDYVVVGTTNPEYLALNLKANDIKLDKNIISKIEKAYSDLELFIKNKYGQTMRQFRGLNARFY
ncbi:MAG: aldo/keto reductase [Candidatus Shapirobacteria bacterium]|jgi:aryl-alcohol dehydrogenase-like predicted oxidoreductase